METDKIASIHGTIENLFKNKTEGNYLGWQFIKGKNTAELSHRHQSGRKTIVTRRGVTALSITSHADIGIPMDVDVVIEKDGRLVVESESHNNRVFDQQVYPFLIALVGLLNK